MQRTSREEEQEQEQEREKKNITEEKGKENKKGVTCFFGPRAGRSDPLPYVHSGRLHRSQSMEAMEEKQRKKI